MATIATEYLADETTADVIIEIAKPEVRQKKLYLAAKRVFDIVFSALADIGNADDNNRTSHSD